MGDKVETLLKRLEKLTFTNFYEGIHGRSEYAEGIATNTVRCKSRT
jgi:hypothetical protein